MTEEVKPPKDPRLDEQAARIETLEKRLGINQDKRTPAERKDEAMRKRRRN